MKIYELENNLPKLMNDKLLEFERLFSYPLSSEKRFFIDHAPYYPAFYQAIGLARIVVAEEDEQIVAVISVASRKISVHGAMVDCAYVGDLKIHPEFRSGSVLYKMAKLLQVNMQPFTRAAYGVAMDGTSVTPDKYTGRLGMPLFAPLTTLHILRVNTTATTSDAKRISWNQGYELFKALHSPMPILDLASFNTRSLLEPVWFGIGSRAVAMVEDTIKAKRLRLIDGTELHSAHISYFEFSDVSSAIEILRACVALSNERKYPAVFVAMSEAQYSLVCNCLGDFRFEHSIATLYGTENSLSGITINTSEI